MKESSVSPINNLDHFLQILTNVEDLNPKMPINNISFNSRFKEDLGFDSLAMMILFVELQQISPSLQVESLSNWSRVEDCLQDMESFSCK